MKEEDRIYSYREFESLVKKYDMNFAESCAVCCIILGKLCREKGLSYEQFVRAITGMPELYRDMWKD